MDVGIFIPTPNSRKPINTCRYNCYWEFRFYISQQDVQMLVDQFIDKLPGYIKVRLVS